MITLGQFIRDTQGKKIAVPWFPFGHKGQCVSLVQQYVKQCLGQPAKARGHAKDWIRTYVSEGLGTITNSGRYGDLIVFPHEGDLGHIGIYINSTTLYDQNNGRHDNRYAGYGKIFSKDYVLLRPNANLLPERVDEWTAGTYKLLYDKAIRKKHRLGEDVIVRVKNCGRETKKYLTSTKRNDFAFLKAGTELVCRNIYKDSSGLIWGSYGNCWVVLCNSDGTPQAKKI